MNNGRDCEHGRRVGNCDSCDLAQAEKRIAEIEAERDALAAQVAVAFGDGYYDGFIDGAKHQDNVDLNTKTPNGVAAISDEAMRCSEIAEAEKSKRVGIVSRQELTAQVEVLRSAIDSIRASGKTSGFGTQSPQAVRDSRIAWVRLNEVLSVTPQQHLANVKAERDALVAQVARLENDLRQQKLIHVGFTNESQVQYVTEQKEEGCFYPDSDNGCYIPVYMLDIHAHRVGPDSEIYKEHCERWKFYKKFAEIRAEAGLAGFVAGASKWLAGVHPDYIADADADINADAEKYAAKVRQGDQGTWLKDSNVNGGKRGGE